MIEELPAKPTVPPPVRPAQPAPHPKRKLILWTLTAIFLLLAVAVFLYWLFVWQYEEYTDDAYVSGNQVVVTAQIPGYINTVTVDDSDFVHLGRTLVTLDQTDNKIALDKAKSNLAQTVRNVVQLFQNVGQFKAEKERRKAEMTKAAQDYIHRKNLIDAGAVTKEDFEHSEANFIAAFAATIFAQYQLRSALAEVENTTVETHPMVEQAKQQVIDTWVNLKRCTILSPVEGIVGQKTAQVGQAIQPKDPLMVIVPLNQMWVDANYKETQLKNVRIGQNVKMISDLYGHDVVFHGTVIGIAAATGSVFSALPPQNATGNWIKIVQRLPVRILLVPDEIKQHPLRLGLSMDVHVDTHERTGKMIPESPKQTPLYSTDIFAEQEAGVAELIQDIIRKNSTFSFMKGKEEEIIQDE